MEEIFRFVLLFGTCAESVGLFVPALVTAIGRSPDKPESAPLLVLGGFGCADERFLRDRPARGGGAVPGVRGLIFLDEEVPVPGREGKYVAGGVLEVRVFGYCNSLLVSRWCGAILSASMPPVTSWLRTVRLDRLVFNGSDLLVEGPARSVDELRVSTRGAWVLLTIGMSGASFEFGDLDSGEDTSVGICGVLDGTGGESSSCSLLLLRSFPSMALLTRAVCVTVGVGVDRVQGRERSV